MRGILFLLGLIRYLRLRSKQKKEEEHFMDMQIAIMEQREKKSRGR